MFLIARKNLFNDKTKFAISVGGVAFSVLLILMLNGVYQGWNQALGSYAESIPADLWVEQDGVGDMFHTLSFLPDNLAQELESIEGVALAQKYLGRQMVFKQNGQDASLFVVGFNTETGLGRPNAMKEGDWKELKMGEIIADSAFLQKYDLKVGDKITISDTPLTIAAVSDKGNLMMAQYAFITFEQAEQLFKIGDKVNFYIVNVKEGANLAAVKEQIKEKIPGTKTLTKEEYVDASRQTIVDGFLPIVYVLVFISVLVGIAVIGLTIYSSTVEKSR